MVSAMPGLLLPSQPPQRVTACWPVPSYIAWWHAYKSMNNLYRVRLGTQKKSWINKSLVLSWLYMLSGIFAVWDWGCACFTGCSSWEWL